MTEVKAKLSFLRISPRKVRLVADLVRGKKVNKAIDILSIINKKSAEPIKKLLLSAMANAKNNFNLKEDSLKVAKITVDDGVIIKRWRPRARGRAAAIRKRTSHITVILTGDKEDNNIKPKKDNKK